MVHELDSLIGSRNVFDGTRGPGRFLVLPNVGEGGRREEIFSVGPEKRPFFALWITSPPRVERKADNPKRRRGPRFLHEQRLGRGNFSWGKGEIKLAPLKRHLGLHEYDPGPLIGALQKVGEDCL